MCAPVALLAVAATTTAVGGGFSAYSQYKTGAMQNKYYQQMADNSNTEASYALREGEQALETGRLQSKAIQDTASYQGKQLKTAQAEFNASQRAAMAAVGLSGVSAEDVIRGTVSKQQMDEMALRYNADVKSWEVGVNAQYQNQAKRYEAWQSNIEADQYRFAGKASKYAGKVGAFTTLLSTASTVASMGAGGGSQWSFKPGSAPSNIAPRATPRF